MAVKLTPEDVPSDLMQMMQNMARTMREPTISINNYLGGIHFIPSLDGEVCKLAGKVALFHVFFKSETQAEYVLMGEGAKALANWQKGISPVPITGPTNDRVFLLPVATDELDAMLKYKIAKRVEGKLDWQKGDNHVTDMKKFGHIAYINLDVRDL